MRYLIAIFLFYIISSCSDTHHHPGKKQFGLYIENGPRQGFQYFDSSGTEFRYRCSTITITNDSTVPVRLKIEFTNAYNHPCSDSSETLRVFLLPKELTPEKQHYDESMSKELKKFLGTSLDSSILSDKIIKPEDKCVLTFGVLTNLKCEDPSTITMITGENRFNSSGILELDLRLNFDTFSHKNGTCTLIIKCGQVLFLNK